MKRLFSLLLILLLALPASSKKRDDFHVESPYEVSFGLNAGTRNFQYYDLNYYIPGYSPNDNTVLTNSLQTPSFNLGFGYKLNRHITLGAIATYAQSNFTRTAIYDSSVVKDDRCRYMSLAPRIRFDWLNRKYVTLYSSLALGLGFTAQKDTVSGRRSSSTAGYAEATFIGIKAGGKVFGFADISASSTGAMRIGVGYNFKSKK